MKAFGIQQRIQRRLDYFSGSSSMIWRSQFFSNWTSRGKRSFSVLIFSIAKKRCDIAFLDKLILDKHYVLIFSYLYFWGIFSQLFSASTAHFGNVSISDGFCPAHATNLTTFEKRSEPNTFKFTVFDSMNIVCKLKVCCLL